MDIILYYFASVLVALFQRLPLDWVARIGRFGGGAFYYCDARHRRVALRNLTMCFGSEKSPEEIHALALENFKRIGENFVCAIKTSSLGTELPEDRIELVGAEKILPFSSQPTPSSLIFAIGHFGNFELFARLARRVPTHRAATTYRAVKSPALNNLLLKLRQTSGCSYFERRTDGAALRAALRGNDLLLGLLADQHSGDNGLRLPFLGHDCNTSKAPAVFALRFNTPLYTAICYRTRLAHWRVEVNDPIPTHKDGQPRDPADIMRDVNRDFEIAVRRDPANWFWVHNRWKNRNPAPPPAAAKSPNEDPELGDTKYPPPGQS